MTHDERIVAGGLSIDPVFHGFVESELLPAIGFDSATFWAGVEAIFSDLTPENRELLKIRDEFQAKIDQWHRARQGTPLQHAEYVDFLRDIKYLGGSDEFSAIGVENVDVEIAEIAGPQLVVPVSNARFAINAANARWGSLYDALYGTDVISEDNGQERGSEYNAIRGAAVIRTATQFLDQALPLDGVSHTDVNTYGLDRSDDTFRFVASLANGETRELQDPEKFVGFSEQGSRQAYLFRNHGLHVEIQVDPDHLIGREATANVANVVLESAITTIQDCEGLPQLVGADAGRSAGRFLKRRQGIDSDHREGPQVYSGKRRRTRFDRAKLVTGAKCRSPDDD